jgi:alkylated DNA repair dioxygenase AlkB
MNINDLTKEIKLKKNVLLNDKFIFSNLKSKIVWDNSINSRKTASFGVPYNYSGIEYDINRIPDFFNELIEIVNKNNHFTPNNCLINFYYDNKSKMGFHSDQIDILYENTGVAIFSFGSKRTMRFKNKVDKELIYDVVLENNTYFYMSQKSQIDWLHSILPDNEDMEGERFSITLRKIK